METIQKEKTIAQKALDMIRFIPKDKFISYEFQDSKDNSKCCILGHINKKCGNFPHYSKFGQLLREESSKFLKSKHGDFLDFVDISNVNNEKFLDYNQNNQKDRVMQLLRDMIKAGY